MIICEQATFLDGRTIGSGALGPFRPQGKNRSYARYRRNGCTCGVLYSIERVHDAEVGCLRFAPSYQLPRAARSLREWQRFVFSVKEETAVLMSLDEDDGELTLALSGPKLTDLGEIEQAIDRSVGLCCSMYPQVLAYVGGKRALAGREG